MSSESQILFEWTCPQEIVDFKIKQILLRRKIAAPIILLSTASFEVYLFIKCYSFLNSHPGHGIDLTKFSLPFIGAYI